MAAAVTATTAAAAAAAAADGDAGGGDGVEDGDSVEKMLAEMPNRKDTNRFDPETHAVAHGRA